jgi:hypothetical protein
LGCSHLLNHTNIPLIFLDVLVAEGSLVGVKLDNFMCTPSFKCCDLKIQKVIHTCFPLQIAYLPCFKILWVCGGPLGIKEITLRRRK